MRIVDIDMPIGSMIAFMLKWAIASIPRTADGRTTLSHHWSDWAGPLDRHGDVPP
jgi:hypothetical protein